ncbi:hypothetical protein C8F04DRAFT_1184537 [Mycena alexandri]|uniref:F-box domain-containing protein n=1 Tax=Mycena alexandri TaxID=1745969 RepID=A0AAD6SSH8_9AGAR|nr:hypothetical protein C8F04DRAFT_1184537 [Mycena alexandri]
MNTNFLDFNEFVAQPLAKETYAIEQVAAIPGSSNVLSKLIAQYDDDQLFKIALQTQVLWTIISNELHGQTVQPKHAERFLETHGSTGLAVLSAEVVIRILNFMDVQDLMLVARTCKFYHKEANAKIEKEMVNFFKRRDLKWDEVRFMLSHTSSLISGLSATQAAFMSNHRGSGEAKTLDIFTDGVKYRSIFQFLTVATPYSKGITHLTPSDRVRRTIEFKHSDPDRYPFTIAVHICHAEDPRQIVFRQKHSALFVTISGEGFWIADSAHTLNGITFAHPTFMKLQGNAGIDEFKRLARELETEHGITFGAFHQMPLGAVQCGKDLSCPTTIRTSEDGYAFFGHFHRRPLGLKPVSRNILVGAIWALGSVGCDTFPSMDFFVRTFKLGTGAKVGGKALLKHIGPN